VLTRPQREIFDKVKAFVTTNRGERERSTALLAMYNDFPARERKFISTLAEDLHLGLRWDEFDEEDRNLVTWRFPGAVLQEEQGEAGRDADGGKQNGHQGQGQGQDGDEADWEDVDGDDDDDDDDAEGRAAVERVLRKYEKAHVAEDDEGGGFDARHDRSIQEKMDEWKRGYYQVRVPYASRATDVLRRLVGKT
jgi:5'-3' exoribonuclease 1